MTEREWLACSDSLAMLRFLGKRGSNRKLRLFAVACGRRLFDLLADGRSLRALELAEGYADGAARRKEVQAAHLEARTVAHEIYAANVTGPNPWPPSFHAAHAASEAAADTAASAAYQTVYHAETVYPGRRMEERACHAYLLRDIFGPLPFRLVPLAPEVLTWNAAAIPGLAASVYEERELPAGTLSATRLGILADALEDAGCSTSELVGHLRGPGPHVRGCFAVDLLLGLE
jgi:hypothetical protein